MTNEQATSLMSVLLLGNTPTEKSQQVTSNFSLIQTVPTLQKNTPQGFLNSYFFY